MPDLGLSVLDQLGGSLQLKYDPGLTASSFVSAMAML